MNRKTNQIISKNKSNICFRCYKPTKQLFKFQDGVFNTLHFELCPNCLGLYTHITNNISNIKKMTMKEFKFTYMGQLIKYKFDNFYSE